MRARRINLVLRNRSYVINGLRIAWVALVLWFEVGVFRLSLRGCSWPDAIWKEKLKDGYVSPAHLLVIADPQVLDSHSLPSVWPWLRRLVRFIMENNLRKSWTVARNLNPDGVLFLGDMINGGRYARSDEEYDSFTAKFRSLFTLPSNTPAYYVVGNRDVGLGRLTQFSQRARARFEKSFNISQPNRVVEFGNHSLVLIDAPGLIEEDYRRVKEGKVYPLRENPDGAKKGGKVQPIWTPSAGGAMELIKTVAEEREAQPNPFPLILFSHIPLARSERSSCGSLREGQGTKSHIQKGAGPGYQNLLDKATSTWLLETLEPNAIFTADDHDYCEITHSYLGARASGTNSTTTATQGEQDEFSAWTLKHVREKTVKTFSMNPGIRHPGIQLISLWNPTSSDSAVLPPEVEPISSTSSLSTGSEIPTFADKACLLPDQTAIYFRGYLPLVLLSLALIAWLNLKTSPLRSKMSLVTPRNKSLPFFDTPGNARFFETPTTIDDPEDTPRGHEMMAHTTSRQQRSSLQYSNAGSGPVSRGSSPFPSPLLGPVLVPPEMDGDSGCGGADDDDEDTPTAHGTSRAKTRNAGDEEKGPASGIGSLRTGVLRTPTTPASPWNESSHSFPSSPTPGPGEWGRGGTRSLFGQAGLGIGLGSAGSNRGWEKASGIGDGWRRIRSGAGERLGSRATWPHIMTVGRWCWHTISGIMLGRTMRPSNGLADTFWRRCMWDALCVMFSGSATYRLVTWWFIW